MEKKQYNISYYRSDTKTLLECRQCSHRNYSQAQHEARLYSEWAKYHYDCKVYFKIETINPIF